MRIAWRGRRQGCGRGLLKLSRNKRRRKMQVDTFTCTESLVSDVTATEKWNRSALPPPAAVLFCVTTDPMRQSSSSGTAQFFFMKP